VKSDNRKGLITVLYNVISMRGFVFIATFMLLLLPITFADERPYPEIDTKILAADSDTVDIIVEMDSSQDYQNYISSFETASDVKKFRLGNFYSMAIKKSEIPKLESMPVKRAWLEKEYKLLLDVAVPLVNASTFWDSGYNGRGIKVCVIDTGINNTHPALSSSVIAEKDFVTDDMDGDTAEDFHGHGTHVAGIVASTNSTYRGVAFGASILNAKVFSSTTVTATTESIIEGVEWCIDQGADILTLSLGEDESLNDGSDALSQYLDGIVNQGKIVAVAAGNSGPGSVTINCPGCAHNVITVGSTSKADSISSFSSRGPTADSRIKPDVTAPGEAITSTWKDGGYRTLSGTSMSTPVVAGLSALILQARSMTPGEMKALLMNTAVDLGTYGKDNSYGAGRINASRAFSEINNTRSANIINSTVMAHNILLPNNTKLRATLYWPETYDVHNNLDLYIVDPSGVVRGSSTSINNTDEFVVSNITVPGYWKIVVNATSVVGSQNYSIAASFPFSGQMHAFFGSTSGILFHQINITDSSLVINLDSLDAGLGLYLYNASGHLISTANSTHNNTHKTIELNNSSPGIWTAKITASRPANYSLTSNHIISAGIKDNALPSIIITSPVNKSYSTQNISLSFIVNDNMHLQPSCTKTLDGNLTQIDGVLLDSIYESSFIASEGVHEINITCTDAAGNTNISSVSFSVDTTAMGITFIETDSDIVGRNYTFIAVNVSDAEDVDRCILEWDGVNESITKSGSGNSVICFANKTDSDGLHAYKIYSNDSAGTIASIARSIIFDTTAPVILGISPLNSSYIDNKSEVFTIMYAETNMESVTMFWATQSDENFTSNKTSACPSGTRVECNFTLDLSKFYNDALKFYFEIRDKVNKSSVSAVRTVFVDRVPFTINFIPPTPNNETTNTTVIINVTTGETPHSILLEWNGINETMDGSGVNWFKAKGNLPYGNYTFLVYANDSAGNTNISETRWVFVNGTKHGIDISWIVSNKNITVAIFNSAGGFVNISNLSSANYTLVFNLSSILIEADFPGSSLNLSGSVDITENPESNIESNISLAFSESGGVMDKYVWVEMNNLLQPGSFTAKIIFPRTYALYFYLDGSKDSPTIRRISECNANISNMPCYNVSDIPGNTPTLYLPSFSGAAAGNDTQTPALGISSPLSTSYSSSSIPLTYTVNDNIAVDKCWYSLNGGSNITLDSCANTTITASQGSNIIIIYANDTSNNTNQTAVTFTFAPPSPPPSFVSTSSGGGSSKVNNANNLSNMSNTNANSNQPAKTVSEQQGSQSNQTNQANIESLNETGENKTMQESNETNNKTISDGIQATGFAVVSPTTFAAGIVAIIVAEMVYLLHFRGTIKSSKKVYGRKKYVRRKFIKIKSTKIKYSSRKYVKIKSNRIKPAKIKYVRKKPARKKR